MKQDFKITYYLLYVYVPTLNKIYLLTYLPMQVFVYTSHGEYFNGVISDLAR